jgi:dTDP-4-amino-4,6-dideoxygalactose transaminase
VLSDTADNDHRSSGVSTGAAVRIPFVDLHAQYLTIKPEIDGAIADVIATSAFIRGPYVERFEAEYARLLGVEHCISCANGTDALYIALRGLDLRPGDEVITTAHSWIATSETITQAGGRVVFCDTDADTFTIDPAKVEPKITPRTRGIVVVHLYGQPADMDPIMDLAARRGLWVLEDCAQAHFARYKGQYVGTFGRVATFSFYPGKNLGAMGDAGCVVTRDADLARVMTMFARHGGLKKNDHEIEGINSRMDGLQAAVLVTKLPHVPAWTSGRQRVAAVYDRELAGVGDIVTPKVAPGREHVYHLYVVRTDERDELRAELFRAGIDTVLNYPVALPFLKAYARLGHTPRDFPVAHANQSRILSLPIYPEIPDDRLDYVVSTMQRFFQSRPARAIRL